MRLPAIPDPRDVLGELVGLAPRVLRLLASAEDLLDRARVVVQRVEDTRAQAADAIARIEATADRADGLVVRLEPSVIALLPALEQLAGSVTPQEVRAICRLVDTLPGVVERVESALPVVAGLESVAPDLGDLLAASRELNELLLHLPGMGRVRRRVEEEQAEAEEGTDPDAPDAGGRPGD